MEIRRRDWSDGRGPHLKVSSPSPGHCSPGPGCWGGTGAVSGHRACGLSLASPPLLFLQPALRAPGAVWGARRRGEEPEVALPSQLVDTRPLGLSLRGDRTGVTPFSGGSARSERPVDGPTGQGPSGPGSWHWPRGLLFFLFQKQRQLSDSGSSRLAHCNLNSAGSFFRRR